MLQEVINDAFVPSLAGEDTPFTPTQNRLFSLPASQGGLGIPQLKEQASIQFSASLNLTSAHRESIKDQDTCVREKNRDGHTQSTLRYHYQTLKLARLKGKTAAIHQALPQPLKPYMKQSQDTGASSWLNAIPKEDEDWVFSKQEFRDCVRLRYNHPIPDLPSYCVCKDKPVYTVQHAQQCSRGGFINERHDSLRDFFTVLLDKVCNGVKAEPHLTNLSGEELAYKTAIKGDDARADIKARGFWRRGVDAYFDVSFANVNAESYKDLDTATIFAKREKSKKREYGERVGLEHATLTPLIFGTNGGMGAECSMFVKELAKKLSKKRNEELNVTMCWLRTKISFLCQRAALLCVRGSRTPWYKENTKAVSEDFRLTVHEADLDLRIADDDKRDEE